MEVDDSGDLFCFCYFLSLFLSFIDILSYVIILILFVIICTVCNHVFLFILEI